MHIIRMSIHNSVAIYGTYCICFVEVQYPICLFGSYSVCMLSIVALLHKRSFLWPQVCLPSQRTSIPDHPNISVLCYLESQENEMVWVWHIISNIQQLSITSWFNVNLRWGDTSCWKRTTLVSRTHSCFVGAWAALGAWWKSDRSMVEGVQIFHFVWFCCSMFVVVPENL